MTSLTRPSPVHAAVPGLLLAAAVAAAASAGARLTWLQEHGVSALTLAIAMGLAAGNLLPGAAVAASADGLNLAKQRLLRAGIVLYGLRLTFQDIGHVGLAGVAVDAAVLCSTFGLACLLGTRLFGLSRPAALLIGAGSAICGAAAVLATEPVVRGKPEDVAVAVATVVGFGSVAMFLYPAASHLLALPEAAYGLWAGSTIHEVAQVVAAGHAVGDAAADIAVIAKMVRVMMLAPFLLALSAWNARGTPAAARAPVTIPWFALGFVALAGVRSLDVLPAPALALAGSVDAALLAVAMAALGLATRLSAMKAAGFRPLALGATLLAWLVLGGGAINAVAGALARV